MLHGNLAHIARMTMSRTKMQNDGADIEALTLHMLHGVFGFGALNRRLIDDDHRRSGASNLQQVRKLWQRLKRKQVRFDRRQHQVRATSSLGGIRTRMGWGIDDDEINALQTRLFDSRAQSCRVSGNHPGHFGFAPIRPF